MTDPRADGRGGNPDGSDDDDELADQPTRLHTIPLRVKLKPADPAAGSVVAGKYQLERLVARGGMGTIWDALDTDLERHVAIKFMDPKIAANEDLRQRFTREARAVARLRTPHVVQIYEHGLFDAVPYIVMELLEGEDLHARLKRQAPLPLDEAALIVSQIARGLRTAHEAGIIHRDLKPQNIFLARQDGEQVAKILDFGVAKMRASFAGFETRVGTVLGSPNYMAPEQARSAPQIDHRADVWSLGAIAFRAVTGKMAFPGEIAGAVIIKICAEPPPMPSKIRGDLPREMDAFFTKVFQRNPDDRYQSAREAAEAFTAAVRAALGALGPAEVGYTPQPSPLPELGRLGTPLPSPQPLGSSPAHAMLAHAAAPPPFVSEADYDQEATVLTAAAPATSPAARPAGAARPPWPPAEESRPAALSPRPGTEATGMDGDEPSTLVGNDRADAQADDNDAARTGQKTGRGGEPTAAERARRSADPSARRARERATPPPGRAAAEPVVPSPRQPESEGSGSHTPYTGPSVGAVTSPSSKSIDSAGERLRQRRSPGRRAAIGGLVAGAIVLAGVFALVRSGEQSVRGPGELGPPVVVPSAALDASPASEDARAGPTPSASPSDAAPSTAEPGAPASSAGAPSSSAEPGPSATAASSADAAPGDAGTKTRPKKPKGPRKKGPDWGY
jgi:serine/threonine protein kinase